MLRDKTLCGLCLKVGVRSNTFIIATSVRGKQVRITLGRWPLISVDDAREQALPILRKCRSGEYVMTRTPVAIPTLREVVAEYAKAKRVKDSSLKRYQSVLRTHFKDWFDLPVSAMTDKAFGEHCYRFAGTKGAAIVDLGRGILSSIIKFLDAVYGLSVPNPFLRLGAAGLMPSRPSPRIRKLNERDLSDWWQAIGRLSEKQQDYLSLVALTGLRKNEARAIKPWDVDLVGGVLSIPETKRSRPHSLPITPEMRAVLARRCHGLGQDDKLFEGVSADHVSEMAERIGAPKFMLHDLRKLIASIGSRLAMGDAVLRRILGHAPKRGDVLHRHYVSLDVMDIAGALAEIQSVVVSARRVD
jgi:integrase